MSEPPEIEAEAELVIFIEDETISGLVGTGSGPWRERIGCVRAEEGRDTWMEAGEGISKVGGLAEIVEGGDNPSAASREKGSDCVKAESRGEE